MNVKDLTLDYEGSTAILDEVLDDLNEVVDLFPEAVRELFRQEPARLVQVSTRIEGRKLIASYEPTEYLNGFAEALKAAKRGLAE